MTIRSALGWMPLLALTLAVTSHVAAASDVAFQPRPCDANDTRVRCGIVRVPENYSKPGGRQIELWVVILPASAPEARDVAQFDLEGGPGFAATDFAAFYLGEGAPYRHTRDVVLVDRRGTGRSAPLRCPAIEAYQRADAWAPLYPPRLVAECAAALRGRADLAQYTTAIAAHDLDVVREALGYRSVHLNAVSYGTTLALRYIADYPERARSAVMIGTAPDDRMPPRFHAAAAERALDQLLRECRGDVACSSAFPDVAADLERARGQFSGPRADVRRAVFMEKLRTLMYTTAGQRRLPWLVSRAATGRFEDFERSGAAGTDRVFADGLYLAVTCSESFGRFDANAARAEARRTRFGDYRLARQQAACARWPRASSDARSHAPPVRYDVPVLFVAGDNDPVTPPDWAAALLPAFPNGKLISVRHGAHVLDGLSGLDTCLDRIVLEFYARGSTVGLDTRCFATMQPVPFQTAAVPSNAP